MWVIRCVACSCACAHMFVPSPPHGTPLFLCSFGSGGNVTPVPGIAASLDPGNSDDRNRLLLPLQHTHCLATGSPHTFPKPFSKGVFFNRCRSRSPPSGFFPPHALFVVFLSLKRLKGEGIQHIFLCRTCCAQTCALYLFGITTHPKEF